MSITGKTVQELRQKLQGAPAVDPAERELTMKAAVEELRPEIHALRARGYSWERVLEMLQAGGLELKLNTLKAFAGSSRSKKSSEKRSPRARKARGEPAGPAGPAGGAAT